MFLITWFREKLIILLTKEKYFANNIKLNNASKEILW